MRWRDIVNVSVASLLRGDRMGGLVGLASLWARRLTTRKNPLPLMVGGFFVAGVAVRSGARYHR